MGLEYVRCATCAKTSPNSSTAPQPCSGVLSDGGGGELIERGGNAKRPFGPEKYGTSAASRHRIQESAASGKSAHTDPVPGEPVRQRDGTSRSAEGLTAEKNRVPEKSFSASASGWIDLLRVLACFARWCSPTAAIASVRWRFDSDPWQLLYGCFSAAWSAAASAVRHDDRVRLLPVLFDAGVLPFAKYTD